MQLHSCPSSTCLQSLLLYPSLYAILYQRSHGPARHVAEQSSLLSPIRPYLPNNLVHPIRAIDVSLHNHVLVLCCRRPPSTIPSTFHSSDVQALVLKPCVALLVDVVQAELVALAEVF